MTKRDYGSGSLQERQPGHWRLTVELGRDPVTGRRRRRRFTVVGTKREAQRALREALSERDTSGVDPSTITTGDWLIGWLERHVADGNLGPRTAERNRGIVRRHLLTTIGSIPLQSLRRQHVLDLKDQLSAELAPATVHKILGLLRQGIEGAVVGELVTRNPAAAVPKPSAASGVRERRALDEHEIAQVLAAAAGTAYDVPLRFALATGVRQAELLGATWGALDLDDGTFTVRRTVQHVAGEFLDLPPKTKRSRRTVELSAATVALLRRHRADQFETRLRVGSAWMDHELVFPNPLGSYQHRRTFYGGFRHLVAASGVGDPESVTWHSLRHSAASIWIRAGVDLLTVSRRLGHASAAFTMDQYGHMVAGQQAAAAAALDHLISG